MNIYIVWDTQSLFPLAQCERLEMRNKTVITTGGCSPVGQTQIRFLLWDLIIVLANWCHRQRSLVLYYTFGYGMISDFLSAWKWGKDEEIENDILRNRKKYYYSCPWPVLHLLPDLLVCICFWGESWQKINRIFFFVWIIPVKSVISWF